MCNKDKMKMGWKCCQSTTLNSAYTEHMYAAFISAKGQILTSTLLQPFAATAHILVVLLFKKYVFTAF